ncbi:MAG TPA: NYN domain-containing protein [Planctomycetaceae bacterium]|nr:NYN domain-containing protein [Planctomycetaceae bacterium]
MPIPFHIIDGYNLLHAAGLGRATYGPGDLERSRNRLLGLLKRYLPPAERNRTTVVFDAGDAPPGMPRELTLDGMTILFAVRGGDADTEIEALIAAHSAPRQIRLVSSDHRLQKAARRRRAVAVDCEVFLERIERRGPVAEETRRREESPGPKYGGAVSSAETEHWLAVFGDAFPSAELARDEPPVSDAVPQEAKQGSGSEDAPEAAPPSITSDEVAFWQGRVDELLERSVDRGRPSAENPE